MKKLLALGNLLFFAFVLRGQSDYFLFIQSENNQPYYVQTDGKTLSSSAIGHLIISGLSDSMYTVNIGFPKNQFPEQIFEVRINKKDAGYQLKNMGSEGWALFNLQTLQLIKAQPVESKKQTISYGDIKKTDNFSTLMAGLVNDSAVLYTSIAKTESAKESSKTSIPENHAAKTEVVKQEDLPPKESTVANTEVVTQVEEVLIKDSSVTKTNVNEQEIPKKDTAEAASQEVIKKDTPLNSNVVIPQIPAKPDQKKTTDSLAETQVVPAEIKSKELKPLIIWFSETKTSAGIELVFFDMSVADKIDTIKMLILKEDIKNDVINTGDQRDTNDVNNDDQKSGAGKLFAKIFGKKNNPKQLKSDTTTKTESVKNASTIKVTTVENGKPADPTVAKNNDGKKKEDLSSKEPESIKDKGKKDEDQKTGAGKLIGKIFGNKNDSKPLKTDTVIKTESAQNTSTIKVTTVENTKPVDSTGTKNNVSKKKGDLTTKEAESSKDDGKKDDDKKTGAGKLIGKVFGKKNDSKPLNIDTTAKTEPSQNTSSIKVTTVDNGKSTPSPSTPKTDLTKKPVLNNSNCREFASDYDVDKLRVRMVRERDADGQVTEARKVFKVKCFSTAQIKALSELFRTDEGKYKLFDAAYPYVSDSSNFKDLAALLSEEYYINRFKAMVRM